MPSNPRQSHSFFLEATLLLGSTMTVMAGATIAPALPQMNEYFQSAPHAALLVKMLLSVHALFIAISAPFIGILMDRHGRKPVLITTVALYGIAGSSGFFLNSLYLIILGRALLGISVAGIISGFTTLIGDYFKGEKLNQVMGLQAAFSGFGGMIFLTVGGFLADTGWRYPFLIYLFAFLVLPGVLAFLYEPQIKEATKENPSGNVDTLPKVPPKKVIGIYFFAFFGMMLYYIIPVQLPFYMSTEGNYSSTKIGLAIGILSLTNAISAMQFKKVKNKLSHIQILILFSILMSAGYTILYLAGGYVTIIAGLIITGCGFGLLMPNVNVWIVSLIPASARGRFIGGLTTFFLLGQFASPLVLEPLVRNVGIGNCFGGAGMLLLAVAIGLYIYPKKEAAQ